MAVTLYSLGAAQEVTGSKHVFEIDGRAFMIDCGAFQGHRKVADEKNRNFSFSPEKLEAVILTHAHYDHCGLLPVLTKTGFDGNIYATPATRDLADLIMMDSARIQARDAEYLRKQAQKKGEKFTWQPLFTEKDCVKAENQIVSLSYNRKMYIAPDVQLEYFDAISQYQIAVSEEMLAPVIAEKCYAETERLRSLGLILAAPNILGNKDEAGVVALLTPEQIRDFVGDPDIGYLIRFTNDLSGF